AAAAFTGAAIAWIRPEGRSLVHWTLAAIAFTVARQFTTSPELIPEPGLHPRRLPPGDSTSEGELRLRVVAAETQPLANDALPPIRPTRLVADDAGVIELSEPAADTDHNEAELEAERTAPAPVYLGGPQVVTFFSTKGG